MSNPWYAALSGLKLPVGNAPRELPAWQMFHTMKAEVVTAELAAREIAMNDIGARNKIAKELFIYRAVLLSLSPSSNQTDDYFLHT